LIPAQHPEQHLYARWVNAGTRIGFVALVASFACYALGMLEAHLPPQEVARVWQLPVDQYVAAIGGPTGWGWLGLLAKSDYLNHLGVAVLASVSVVAYGRILPALIAQGERLRAAIALVQILILLTAASGWLTSF
jgi:hypothetical protein